MPLFQGFVSVVLHPDPREALGPKFVKDPSPRPAGIAHASSPMSPLANPTPPVAAGSDPTACCPPSWLLPKLIRNTAPLALCWHRLTPQSFP